MVSGFPLPLVQLHCCSHSRDASVRLGATTDDTELVDGLVLTQKVFGDSVLRCAFCILEQRVLLDKAEMDDRDDLDRDDKSLEIIV